uniref:BTB domain-containing protein n=1 Tax=Branchiostoma floridae TaxID=7739 RepID=C3YU11_BRAFL|eukprot:XP_002600276.1 hypothetical protein BRAFLDRAFT_66781 [Branchiostoma floridae]
MDTLWLDDVGYDNDRRSDGVDDNDGHNCNSACHVKRKDKKSYDEDNSCRFEDTSYCRELLAELNGQRHTKDFLDLVVKVQDMEFPCHRAVLASTPYFKAMLSSSLSKGNSKVVKLHGIDSDGFSKILDFLYTGEIRISKDDVHDILQAAHMLQIDKITEYCREYIECNLCPSNCIGVMRLADLYGWPDMRENSRDEALSHFPELGQSEEFLTLSVDELLDLLTDKNLYVAYEEEVVDSALRWIDHDPEIRSKATVAIFQEIHLLSLRLSTLKKLELHPVIQNSPECLAKTTSAKERHLATTRQESASAELDEPEVGPRFFTSDDLAIFVGGWRIDEGCTRDHDDNALTIPMQSVICLDPDSEQCYHITNLPTRVTGYMSVTNAKKHLYVTGGRAYPLIGQQGPHSAPSRQAFRYDFLTDTWAELPDMPRGRAGHQSTIVDGKLFLVGGDTDDTSTFSMDRYDLENGAWMKPPALPEIQPSSDLTVRSCGGKLILVELLKRKEKYLFLDMSRSYSSENRKLCVHGYDVKTDHWLYSDVIVRCPLEESCKLVTVLRDKVHILFHEQPSYNHVFTYHAAKGTLSKLEGEKHLTGTFCSTHFHYKDLCMIQQGDIVDSMVYVTFEEDQNASSEEPETCYAADLPFYLLGNSFLGVKKSTSGWYCRDGDELIIS